MALALLPHGVPMAHQEAVPDALSSLSRLFDHIPIMVVDDDEEMREYLRSFLRQRGYDSIGFDNAEAAVQSYERDRPAAIILDVVMPGTMDGLGALAAFKKIDRDVPVKSG